MRFFRTKTGLFNVDSIAAVRRTGMKGAVLVMADGSQEQLSDQFETVASCLNQVIPNTTSVQAVQMVHDEYGMHFTAHVVPVIGWRIGNGSVEGILPNGKVAEYLIVADNRVEHITDGSVTSLAEAEKAYAKQSGLRIGTKTEF